MCVSVRGPPLCYVFPLCVYVCVSVRGPPLCYVFPLCVYVCVSVRGPPLCYVFSLCVCVRDGSSILVLVLKSALSTFLKYLIVLQALDRIEALCLYLRWRVLMNIINEHTFLLAHFLYYACFEQQKLCCYKSTLHHR